MMMFEKRKVFALGAHKRTEINEMVMRYRKNLEDYSRCSQHDINILVKVYRGNLIEYAIEDNKFQAKYAEDMRMFNHNKILLLQKNKQQEVHEKVEKYRTSLKASAQYKKENVELLIQAYRDTLIDLEIEWQRMREQENIELYRLAPK